MSRAFWFAAGAASGVYTLVKARRTLENLTPDGISARLAAWNAGARAFGGEVRAGMAEREAEIVEQLRIDRASPRRIESPLTEGRAEGDRDGHR